MPRDRTAPWFLAPECSARTVPIVLAAILGCAVATAHAAGQDRPDHVMGGWKVFARKQCISCHAVWGLGGQIGPDLGRAEQPNLGTGQLAAAMWNHIPKMHSHMVGHHIEYPQLSADEMSSLFDFLLFVRYLDEPGDAAAGQRTLRDKGCTHCHATDGPASQAAPDLKRWAGYANPIVWAQKMWEHAPKMEKAMERASIVWPQLADTDLINIMAYLRSVGGPEGKVYLEPGSAAGGARLFAERGCQGCHHAGGPGKDLAAASPPRSLAGLASRMWNHSPEMTRMMQAQGITRGPLTAQEMADIISYIISLRYEDRGGDPGRGRAVFEKQQCARCHEPQNAGADATAPGLEALAAAAGPVRLAQAMWNHGVIMMDRMSESGVAWPVLQSEETVDLVAYLRSVGPKTASIPVQSRPAPLPVPLTVLPPAIEVGGSCVTAACHPSIVAGREVHTPAAQGECNTCHVAPDPRTHRFQLGSSTSDLCYHCHDEPTEAMQAHGPVPVRVCTACHNPHSAENLLGPGFTGNEACFDEMVGMTVALESLVVSKGGPRTGTILPPAPGPEAAPARQEPDVASRGQMPAGTTPVVLPSGQVLFMPPKPGPVAPAPAAVRPTKLTGGCVTSECHPTIAAGQFVHGPTAQQQCQACHVVLDEQTHRFKLSAQTPDLCYECHDRPAPSAFQHGPFALGMCTACHSPHSAPQKFLLPEAGNDLCFLCHVEMRDALRRARVPHEVIPQKGCTACHDPHQTAVRFQLKKDMPDLCLECHAPIGEIINTATVQHEPVATQKKCVNCHNPHGSDVPKILTNVEMDLCLDCHDKPMETPEGPIINMASWIRDNPEQHGPIRNRNCTDCHQPHGSKNFRILQHSFPREFYQPYSPDLYALCFECHEATLVRDKRTTTLTDFRNGDKNLHYIHVNQEKGRTCRACHEIHAGTKPKRIKDFVPFGQWKYPVNFEKTDNGGRCAPGCHVDRAYDRRKEIVAK